MSGYGIVSSIEAAALVAAPNAVLLAELVTALTGTIVVDFFHISSSASSSTVSSINSRTYNNISSYTTSRTICTLVAALTTVLVAVLIVPITTLAQVLFAHNTAQSSAIRR